MRYQKRLPDNQFERAKFLIELYRTTGVIYSNITEPHSLSSLFFTWELLRQEEVVRRIEGNFERACACSLMADHIECSGALPDFLNGYDNKKTGFPSALVY